MDAYANAQPTTTTRKLSSSGMLLILILSAAGIYGVTRSIDVIDRLHFISRIENGQAQRDIETGVITPAQFDAQAKAIDDRGRIFVYASWVLAFLTFVFYRRWFAESPRRLLPPAKQWLGKLTAVLWVVVIATQFTRYLFSGNSLSALKTSSWINLISRALIIPAVILSIKIIRMREGLEAPTPTAQAPSIEES